MSLSIIIINIVIIINAINHYCRNHMLLPARKRQLITKTNNINDINGNNILSNKIKLKKFSNYN